MTEMSKMSERGIVATEADVGRRVKVATTGFERFGKLADHKGCGCGRPCCYVDWDDGVRSAAWQARLQWADEELL